LALQHFGVFDGRRGDGVARFPLLVGEVLLLHFGSGPGVGIHLVGPATAGVERDRLPGFQQHDDLTGGLAGVSRAALLEERATGSVLDDADAPTEAPGASDEEEATIRVVVAGNHHEGSLFFRLDDLELSLGQRRESHLQVRRGRPVGALGCLGLLFRVVAGLGRFGSSLVVPRVECHLAVVRSNGVLRHRGDILDGEELAVALVSSVDEVRAEGGERVGAVFPGRRQNDVFHDFAPLPVAMG
jgi:hypothetical protein